MFKRFFFAVVPMLMAAGSVMASDDLLSTIANLDGAKSAAQVEAADALGQADVDALLGEDKDKSTEEAVAACYRRMGYGSSYGSYSGYGYGGYGYSSYGSYYGGYRSYASPYSYSSYSSCYSYPSYSCYTPSYSYCAPVSYTCYSPCYSSYWGCW